MPTDLPFDPSKVRGGLLMSLLDRLFGRKSQPRQRIRICVECGMPVAEHKDWCSIFRTQQEIDRKAGGAPNPNTLPST
jgi:hypothetical protein